MERKKKSLRKRNMSTEEGPLELSKRVKQNTKTKSTMLTAQSEGGSKNKTTSEKPKTVRVNVISSNRFLDNLGLKITKRILEYIRLVYSRKKESEQESMKISFKANQPRKLIFQFKPSSLKPKNKPRDDYEEFVRNEFDGIRQKARNALFVYYKDFIKETDKSINKIFSKLNLPFDTKLFWMIYKDYSNGVETFKTRKLQDISLLFNDFSEFRVNVEKFPRYPLQTRKYVEISKYQSALNKSMKEHGDMFSADSMLKSDLKPNCRDCQCDSTKLNTESYCEISKFRNTYKSTCKDKASNIECDDNCGCNQNCINRPIQQKNTEQLKKRVEVKLCWGADLFTRKNLCCLMPSYLTFEQQSYYANKIISGLNEYGYEGWNISHCLRTLVKESEKEITLLKKKPKKNNLGLNNLSERCFKENKEEKLKMAEESLLVFSNLLKNSLIAQVRPALRIHSKGLGVVCGSQQGIKKNSLVVNYLGEVYPPWFWCIKQDVIKSFLLMVKKGKLKNFAQYKNNFNIDFYNIMLEKHRNEPKGRDVVIVDPIIRGNFASRLSHSCDPNVVALPVVSKGKYSIAMFALRPIAPGEELTFDYCSFTESETEFRNSVCLCGTLLCKGHYLGYTKKHVNFFAGEEKSLLLDHSATFFMVNNACVLKGCLTSFDDKKAKLLLEYGLGDNTFKDAPLWLKNWAFFVLETIIKERSDLYKKLLDKEYFRNVNEMNPLSQKEVLAKFEIDSLYFQRINNLIISIDKMGFFIRKQNKKFKTLKPLKQLNLTQHINIIKKILENVKDCLSRETTKATIEEVDSYLKNKPTTTIPNLLSDISKNKKYKRFLKGKFLLLKLSSLLHNSKEEPIRALGDILHFSALTIVYFTSTTYDSFSIPIDVRHCDLTNSKRSLQLNTAPESEQLDSLLAPIITLQK